MDLRILLLITATLLVTISNAQSNDAPSLPESISYVSDFEEILTPSQIKKLNRDLSKIEDRTSYQFALVTIESYASSNSLKEYGHRLFDSWGIGTKNENKGLLIILSKKSRRIEIITDKGMSEVLSDTEIGEILEASIVPAFKKDNYYKGIKKGIHYFYREIRNN